MEEAKGNAICVQPFVGGIWLLKITTNVTLKPFTQDSRYGTLSLTMLLYSLLLVTWCGSRYLRGKLWRTSIEDPFETFDSVNPHDLGAVISRSGQALLKKEWERG